MIKYNPKSNQADGMVNKSMIEFVTLLKFGSFFGTVFVHP